MCQGCTAVAAAAAAWTGPPPRLKRPLHATAGAGSLARQALRCTFPLFQGSCTAAALLQLNTHKNTRASWPLCCPSAGVPHSLITLTRSQPHASLTRTRLHTWGPESGLHSSGHVPRQAYLPSLNQMDAAGCAWQAGKHTVAPAPGTAPGGSSRPAAPCRHKTRHGHHP